MDERINPAGESRVDLFAMRCLDCVCKLERGPGCQPELSIEEATGFVVRAKLRVSGEWRGWQTGIDV